MKVYLKPTPLPAVCVCSMLRLPQSLWRTVDGSAGETHCQRCGLKMMFLMCPWAEQCQEVFDPMDHLLWQPPSSTASKNEEGSLRPALVVASCQGKCGPVSCVLADDLLTMHIIYICFPSPVVQRTWSIWVSKSFLNSLLWQAWLVSTPCLCSET